MLRKVHNTFALFKILNPKGLPISQCGFEFKLKSFRAYSTRNSNYIGRLSAQQARSHDGKLGRVLQLLCHWFLQ